MKVLFGFILSLLISTAVCSQQAANFVVTDVHGVTHDLYADHLDQGKTVMIELFFTTCPPCISIASFAESLYQEWGAGQGDVEFIKITTQSFDNDAKILDFDDQYGVTFPGVSVEGGAMDAIVQFTDGTFGPFYGTPVFIVIAPDGTVTYDISFNNLGDVIESTGAVGLETIPPAMIDVKMNGILGNTISIPSIAKVWLKSYSNPNIAYDLGNITNNSFTFEYPIPTLGNISNPYIEVESIATPGAGLSALDLAVLQKHVLDVQLITNQYKLAAADINKSGSVSALDIIELVKVTLGVQTGFNNNKAHLFFIENCPSCGNEFPINVSPGDTVELKLIAAAVGDVN